MTDFYEDDEPADEVQRAFDAGEKFITGTPGEMRTTVTGPCARGGACKYAHTGYAWTCVHRYVTA